MKRALPFYSNAVWPPLGAVIFFAVTYALFACALQFIYHGSFDQEVVASRTMVLEFAAVCYVLYRLVRFHPVCNSHYAAWLKASPWTAARPLPLGPIHPVGQDVVVVGILCALERWHAHGNWTLPLVVFGIGYLIGMTILLVFTGTWLFCFVLGFLWPTLFLTGDHHSAEACIYVALSAAVLLGQQESLRAFRKKSFAFPKRALAEAPASRSFLQTEIRFDSLNHSLDVQLRGLGWPYGCLSAKIRTYSITTPVAAGVSALIGWWTYCVTAGSDNFSDGAPILFLILASLTALGRLMLYFSGITTPFNFWGRITSGRIIIPAFDQVFLTPLTVVALGIVGGSAIKHSGLNPSLVTACLTTLIWFVLLSGGPTLRKWLLTGALRFSQSRIRTNLQFIKPI